MEKEIGAGRVTPIAARALRLGASAVVAAVVFLGGARAQIAPSSQPAVASSQPYQRTTDDYNRRLADLDRKWSQQELGVSTGNDLSDYRIGPDDLLDISVLEAPEFNRSPRVSAGGEISIALIGTLRAAGLTTRELEIVIEELLRQHYIKDPHVSVQVKEMQSHPVAVFGAVKKPGVFQLRGPKTVVEMLSMAEGLDVDAGDTVLVEHRGEPAASTAAATPDPTDPRAIPAVAPADPPANFVKGAESAVAPVASPAAASLSGTSAAATPTSSANTVVIDLKKLLSTGDARLNVLVYPGDVVKVPRADLVYVVGEVAKPGGFELKSNENVSVLQAIALAQGLTHTSASGHSRIIRTNPVTGARQEIPIDLNKILAGKIADPILEPRDILFVPNSASRLAIYRGVEAAVTIGSGVAIYRR
ncbi:MAG TPA: polysaccharide biosynthesis/export family protein [Candidatus Acidoferrales bacterium]|nr:polysaccharide biosynthesis/export family protein [Candidatus Acidoferrales bacterium]